MLQSVGHAAAVANLKVCGVSIHAVQQGEFFEVPAAVITGQLDKDEDLACYIAKQVSQRAASHPRGTSARQCRRGRQVRERC